MEERSVTVSLSSVTVILHKSKKPERDVTYPLLMSISTTGIIATVTEVLISVTVWQRLEKNVFLSKTTFVFMMFTVTTIISTAELLGLKIFAVFYTIYIQKSGVSSIVKKFTGFLIANIRHKIKTRHLIRPTDQMVNNERRQAVIKGLWSSRGVWKLAMVRLTLHLPFFALIETELRESDKAFFPMWFMPMMMSFWESMIYAAFHKGMRNMVVSYLSCWKSNGIRNTETRSTRVNAFTSVRFLRTKIATKVPFFRSCIL